MPDAGARDRDRRCEGDGQNGDGWASDYRAADQGPKSRDAEGFTIRDLAGGTATIMRPMVVSEGVPGQGPAGSQQATSLSMNALKGEMGRQAARTGPLQNRVLPGGVIRSMIPKKFAGLFGQDQAQKV